MSTAKTKNLSPGQLAAIGRLFGVLSEPNRLTLLQALLPGPRTVSQLMEACSMKQANVSKHLAVLFDHQLVKRKREGVSVLYEIADPMIFGLCNLVCSKMERDARRTAALLAPEI